MTNNWKVLSRLVACSVIVSAFLAAINNPAYARHHAHHAARPEVKQERAKQQEEMNDESQPTEEQTAAPSEQNSISSDESANSNNDPSAQTDSTMTTTNTTDVQTEATNGLQQYYGKHKTGDLANVKALGNIFANSGEILFFVFLFSFLTGGGLLGGLFFCAIVWHCGKLFRGGRKPAIG